MTYPSRKKLTEYPIVTPTLADSAVNIQGNTVKRSTLQSIFNLFSASLPPAPTPTPGNLPYKSYVALVTQSGLNNNLLLTSGLTELGVTYEITVNAGQTANFKNIGAPSNAVGTIFVATGVTPATWGVNGTLKYNEAVPYVQVFENTVGNVWWSYDSVGNYVIHSTEEFPITKTWFNPVVLLGVGGNTWKANITNYGISTGLKLQTSNGVIFKDGGLYFTPIEIRVYG